MLDTIVNPKEEYQHLIHAAHVVVNSGADPAEVEDFIAGLAPIYERNALHLPPPPLLMAVGAEPGERPQVELPQAYVFDWWQDALLGTALMAVPLLGVTVNVARPIAALNAITIGLGPQISGGFGVGVSLGCGLCVSSTGQLGWYGSVEVMGGILASISLTAQLTIIHGGIDKFTGSAWGAGVSGGEIIVGNAAALLSMTVPPEFLGITVGIGLGAGIPMEYYFSGQHTWGPAPEPVTQ